MLYCIPRQEAIMWRELFWLAVGISAMILFIIVFDYVVGLPSDSLPCLTDPVC
jgi:hypothetical protein